MLKFKELTEGAPADGQGKVVAMAGTPVDAVLRVSWEQSSEMWQATVRASCYHLRPGMQKDKVAEVEEFTVDARSLIVA